jgi:hypothetical protein
VLSSSQELYLSTIADVIERMAHKTSTFDQLWATASSFCSIACRRRAAGHFKTIRTISSRAPPLRQLSTFITIVIYSIWLCITLSRAPLSFGGAIGPSSEHIDRTNLRIAE